MKRSLKWLARDLESILGKSEETAHVLHWIEAARRTSPVLFAGAGLSMNAEPRGVMPSWNALVEHLNRSRNADSIDPRWDAELYVAEFGRGALDQVLLDKVPDHKVVPGDAHLALAGVAWHSTLTLNYDTLIERSLVERSATNPHSVIEAHQMPYPTDNDVIHLHGALSHLSW
jgi:hypothetical protein